jgi:hypothetical protein
MLTRRVQSVTRLQTRRKASVSNAISEAAVGFRNGLGCMHCSVVQGLAACVQCDSGHFKHIEIHGLILFVAMKLMFCPF